MLDAVVEELEVFAAEACDEVAGAVGYGDADVDAVDGDADGWNRFLRLRVAWSQDEKEQQREPMPFASHASRNSEEQG